jgi:hypothetical protein
MKYSNSNRMSSVIGEVVLNTRSKRSASLRVLILLLSSGVPVNTVSNAFVSEKCNVVLNSILVVICAFCPVLMLKGIIDAEIRVALSQLIESCNI